MTVPYPIGRLYACIDPFQRWVSEAQILDEFVSEMERLPDLIVMMIPFGDRVSKVDQERKGSEVFSLAEAGTFGFKRLPTRAA